MLKRFFKTHPKATPSPSPYINGEGREALVVDDELLVLDVLESFLEDCGFRVSTTTNFFDAVYLLESQPIDVLICDVGLGTHNGLDIAALAKKRHPEAAVLVISGFPNEMDESRANELGASYAAKPLTLERLSTLLPAAPAVSPLAVNSEVRECR